MANGGHRAGLAAKVAKRKAIVAEKKRLERWATSLKGRVAVASSSPITRCLQSRELFSIGMGYVVVASRLSSGLMACAYFLVDAYCLGVKDVTYREDTQAEFEESLELLSSAETLIDIEPCCARKILVDAVAYAAACGIGPAKDFVKVEKILATVDSHLCAQTFTFGQDGKPFYVQGPSDSPHRIRQIVTTLNQRLGPDGWNFMVEADHDDDDDHDDRVDDLPPRLAVDPA